MACLARDGHEVAGVDVDPLKLEMMHSGKSPIVEEGIHELTREVVASGRVRVTNDVDTPMLGGVFGSNRTYTDAAIDKVTQRHSRKASKIGLTFKKGTDDLRESPLATVAEQLIGKGYHLRIYDPEVNLSRLIGANKRFIEQSIPHIGNLMVNSCEEAVRHGPILVGLGGKDIEAVLRLELRARHRAVNIVGIEACGAGDSSYSAICW